MQHIISDLFAVEKINQIFNRFGRKSKFCHYFIHTEKLSTFWLKAVIILFMWSFKDP